MRQFRVRYEDNTYSSWFNMADFTINHLRVFGNIWKATFKNYQLEYREV